MTAVPVDPATGLAGSPTSLFTTAGSAGSFDVTGDGTRFLMIRRPDARLSDPALASVARIVVVTGWLETLRQKFDGGAR